MKEDKVWTTKDSLLVSFASGAPFLKVQGLNAKQISFRTMQGQEVLRISKQKHHWSGKGSEYHGLRPDGSKAFYLALKRGMTKTGYELTAYPSANQSLPLEVQKKIMGQDAVIMMNGSPIAGVKSTHSWAAMKSEFHVHVAPGMDILLALAVTWIRYDKQNEDAKTAAAAAT